MKPSSIVICCMAVLFLVALLIFGVKIFFTALIVVGVIFVLYLIGTGLGDWLHNADENFKNKKND